MTTAVTEAKPKRTMEKFSIEMSHEAVLLVDSLKDRLDKRSRADVFKSSTLVLNFLLEQMDKGYTLAFTKEENGEQRIVKAFEFMV